MLTTLGDRGEQLADAVDAGQPHARGHRAPRRRRSRPRCASSRRLLAETQQALRREPRAGRAAVAGARPPDPGRPTTRRRPPRELRDARCRRLDRFVDTAAEVAPRRPPARPPARRGAREPGRADRERPDPGAARSSSGSSSCSSATATASSSSPATSAGSTSVNRRAGHLRAVRHPQLRDLAGGVRLRARRRPEQGRRAVAAGARRSARCSSTPAATSNAAACLIRFQIPGLPTDSIVESRGGR